MTLLHIFLPRRVAKSNIAAVIVFLAMKIYVTTILKALNRVALLVESFIRVRKVKK